MLPTMTDHRRSGFPSLAQILRAPVFLAALALSAATTAEPRITLAHLDGPLYVVEDTFYAKENSVVFVGAETVTVVGATWTPETARLLHAEIREVTSKPVTDVIDTNYHPDRAGGNAHWKGIGARIHATEMTRDLLEKEWTAVLAWTRAAIPEYPALEVTPPTDVHAGDFELQGGRIQVLYLGPSHTRDGVFVYFPREHVLYGGCILKEQLGNLAFADVAAYPRTLQALEQLRLPIRTVIAGHFSPVHGPDLIDRYLALLESADRK
jgi:metallo-beta-lactamase class B